MALRAFENDRVEDSAVDESDVLIDPISDSSFYMPVDNETTIMLAGKQDPTPGNSPRTPLPGTPLTEGRIEDEIAPESRCGFIPGYSLLGRLGAGGMGVVYQAVQERLQRIVAVKLLTSQLCRDPGAVEIFKREAMAIARLHHPNIVAAYDYGEINGKFYLVLEYIEGINCAEAIEHHGAFAYERAVQIVRDAVLGLSHAYAAGIIHRDVKPANLMLLTHVVQDASGGAFGGVVKVTDLGLARMAETDVIAEGTVMGTPAYMAPEQARGESVDFRADIYGLGSSLYHMVTGVKPYDHKSAVETLERKQRERLVHPQDIVPDLPDDVAVVMDRMMARARDERYSSYEALLADLQCVLAGKRVGALPVAEKQSSLQPRKKRRRVTELLRRITPKGRQATRRLLSRTGWKGLFGAGIALGALVGGLLARWLLRD